LPAEIGPRPWPVWISFATPCTGIFVPVYLDGTIPATFASAGEPESGVGSGTPSVWCAMRDLQEKATHDFARTLPVLRAGWLEVERAIELERIRVEQEVTGLYASGQREAGEKALTRFMEITADRMLENSKRLLDTI
jgi:hypothetical protein